MWRTPEGDRVLRGPEARLFQYGLGYLVSEIDGFGGERASYVGIPVFDDLSHSEKLGVLELVARCLLVEEVPAPMHTAVIEAAIAAVYYKIKEEVMVDIDEGEFDLRQLIHDTVKAMSEDVEPSDVHDDDRQTWDDEIELVMDRILWDRDWEGSLIGPDDPPEEAAEVRKFMRIDEDYFTAVPPDPNPSQMEQLLNALHELRDMKV